MPGHDVKSAPDRSLSLWESQATRQISSKSSNGELLRQLKQAFHNDIDAALVSAYDKDREALRPKLVKAIDEFLSKVTTSGGTKLSTPFSSVLAQAQAEALKMRREIAEATLKSAKNRNPSLVPKAGLSRGDGAGRPRVNVTHAAPPLRHLVLSGGGGKGLVYGTVLQEMVDHGTLRELDSVAGASAGALAATFFGIGADPQNLVQAIVETDLKRTTQAFDGYDELYGAFPVEPKTLAVSIAGGPGQEALRDLDFRVSSIISSYLKALASGKDPKFKALVEALGQRRIDTLMNPKFHQARDKRMFTFADLAAFRQVDPARFKDVTLVAWDAEHGKTTYMNNRESPDLPVAVAARISMAHPLLYSGIVTNVKAPFEKERVNPAGVPEPESKHRVYRDGGIGSNLPVEAFVPLNSKGSAPREAESGGDKLAETMALVFDEAGLAHRQMHRMTEKDIDRHDAQTGAATLSGNPAYAKTERDDMRKTAMWTGVHVVHHASLQTTTMGATQAERDLANLMASVHTLEQLAQRVNQATYNSFENSQAGAEQCYRRLSPAEKRALLAYDPKEDVIRRTNDKGKVVTEPNPASAFMRWMQALARKDPAVKAAPASGAAAAAAGKPVGRDENAPPASQARAGEDEWQPIWDDDVALRDTKGRAGSGALPLRERKSTPAGGAGAVPPAGEDASGSPVEMFDAFSEMLASPIAGAFSPSPVGPEFDAPGPLTPGRSIFDLIEQASPTGGDMVSPTPPPGSPTPGR